MFVLKLSGIQINFRQLYKRADIQENGKEKVFRHPLQYIKFLVIQLI